MTLPTVISPTSINVFLKYVYFVALLKSCTFILPTFLQSYDWTEAVHNRLSGTRIRSIIDVTVYQPHRLSNIEAWGDFRVMNWRERSGGDLS